MFETGDEPKILTENEIMQLKKKHGVVLFYMNGCGHCVAMKPAWNKIITELKEKHKNEIILGAIESNNMEMFTKHGIKPSVSGFPTILYFHPSKLSNPEAYSGDRSYDSLKEWILEKNNKGKGKGKIPIVIVTNSLKNNKGMGMGMGMGMGNLKNKANAFSQYGGGSRRRMKKKLRKHRKSATRRHTRRRHRR